MHDLDDTEDPHGLALPTKHIARTSMVENLVLSLDQFTPAIPPSHRSGAGGSRAGRHGSSRSITDDTDVQLSARPATSIRIVKPEGLKTMQKEDAILSLLRDDEDSHRSKAYAAQRAVQPQMTKPRQPQHRPTTRSRSGSNSSSVDLGHLATFAGKLGPAGNRRSQSFDFGSSQRPKPMTGSDMDIIHPSTFSVSEASKSSAKNTSANAAPARPWNTKSRSGTVGASSAKPRVESPQPLPPVKHLYADAPERKQTFESRIEPLTALRPGFFRRVFGSSKPGLTAGPGLQTAPAVQQPAQDRSLSVVDVHRPASPSKLQKSTSKTGLETASGKENQPVVTKKPSSFFRRRKKSVSTNVPPPLPLTLGSSVSANQRAETQSPVSSLRAFMDPYLGGASSKDHKRGSSLQSVQNAQDVHVEPAVDPKRDLETDFVQVKTASPTPKVSTGLTNLQIPARGASASRSTDDVRVRTETASPVSQLSPKPAEDNRAISPSSAAEEISSQRQKTPTPNPDQGKRLPAARSESANSVRATPASPTRRPTSHSIASIGVPPSISASEMSVYKSAPSTPLVADIPNLPITKSPHVHISHPSVSLDAADEDVIRAKKISDNPDDLISGSSAAAWLGESGEDREKTRIAYMALFDWTGRNILSALRSLCSKLALKGETQQVDRLLEAFSQRWCACNACHGFKAVDVVHTICYSVLLLNTDLHMADIGQKMTRTQFVKNAMGPIRQAAFESAPNYTPSNYLGVGSSIYAASLTSLRASDRNLRSSSALSNRPTDKLSRENSGEAETITSLGEPLVEMPYTGTQGGWELQVENILKDFYTSISREPLPLFGQSNKLAAQTGNNLLGLSTLRRAPSTISKARSDSRGRDDFSSKLLGSRFAQRTKSRVRLGPSANQAFGSSRTSLDDGSSSWSPMSSTWSRTSLGKTLTSMSVDSLGLEHGGDYQSSIGFANALSQAIIRDEQIEAHNEDGIKMTSLLEDESLELHGAPWAKEGMMKHKCHLDGPDKKSKDRNWNDCFAVIEKGWMRLFSFSANAKSVRSKAKAPKPGVGAVVGGGNWQDNAQEVWKFMLRHTIASSLPPPGYSKQRPYVWALSLPNGAVHLFSVGTPDIVKEFVSTANFWSARLSKEPMTGGVSSMEYGWSDAIINRALIAPDNQPMLGPGSPRPSTQLSMRSSMDHGANFRARVGDKVHIYDWAPPAQSLLPSQLLEVDQLKALQSYVKTVEDDLQRHNELRGPMLLAFSSRLPNSSKAMANWEKKSSYLLMEIVKFGTYIDALKFAQQNKLKVYRMREEDEESRRDAKAERKFELANGED